MAYTVYLIHLLDKLGRPDTDEHRAELGRPPRRQGANFQSQHYIGKCKKLKDRIREHATNQGAHFLAAANRAGICWEVARTWTFPTWEEAGRFERQLKRQKHSARYCPRCNPNARSKET